MKTQALKAMEELEDENPTTNCAINLSQKIYYLFIFLSS
jgi:hypothetical protein